MEKRLFLVVYAVMFICFLPGIALADCECPEKPKLEAAYDQATLVFLGRVELQGREPLKPNYKKVKFSVLGKFKWSEEFTDKTVDIYTPKKKEECGIRFQNGFDYLVFASGNPAFVKTTKCSRTEVLEKARLDHERLRRMVTQMEQ